MRAPALDDLDGVLAAALEAQKLAGASVAVLRRGEIRTGSAGRLCVDGSRPVTADTRFPVGCVIKPMVSTIAMLLVQQGKLDLDVPVQRVLPRFTLRDADAARTITARHLLCHTAGFDGNVHLASSAGDACFAEFVRSCATLPQLHAPGELFSYGMNGFTLLAALLEASADRPFRELLAHCVFEPLGITYRFAPPADGDAAPEPHCRDDDTGKCRAHPPRVRLPRAYEASFDGYGLTAADLARFARWYVDSEPTVSPLRPELRRMMQTPQVALEHTYVPHWGLGWALWGDSGFGHSGFYVGYSSFLRVVPQHGVAIALSINVHEEWALHNAVVGRLVRELSGASALPPPATVALPNDLDRFTGVYEGASRRVRLHLDAGQLRAEVEPLENADLELSRELGAIDHTYRAGSFVLRPSRLGGFRSLPSQMPVHFLEHPGSGGPRWLRWTNRLLRRVR